MPDENSTRGGLAKKALAPLSGLLLASSFLSRLPAPGLVDWEDKRVWSWSFAFYPLCGYGLGAFAALPLLLLIPLPYFDSLPMLSAVFYLALLEWATRFLHFDGFCDCCDAFSAMTLSPERRLEIMKDPHVGSSAVGGGVLLLICKAVVLYMIAYKGVLVYNALLLSFALLVAIPALARLTMLTLAAWIDCRPSRSTATPRAPTSPV
jgi:cobalamin synthase